MKRKATEEAEESNATLVKCWWCGGGHMEKNCYSKNALGHPRSECNKRQRGGKKRKKANGKQQPIGQQQTEKTNN